MGTGTIATLLGVGAPCERYGAQVVISVLNQNQVTYWTQGWGGGSR